MFSNFEFQIPFSNCKTNIKLIHVLDLFTLFRTASWSKYKSLNEVIKTSALDS